MKLQSSELPLGKQQTRRKAPKIAPLILLIFFLTIIPIYYPSLRYNLKKLSEATSSFDSLEVNFGTSTLDDQSNSEEPKGDELVEKTETEQELVEKTETEQKTEYLQEKKEEPEKEQVINLPSSTDEKFDNPRREDPPVIRKRKGRRRRGHRKKDPAIGKQRVSNGDYGSGIKKSDSTNLLVGEHNFNNDNEGNSCDLFTGEWVPNPEGPYYTNETCFAIQEHQNCMKFGRPDRDYLKWKWKPDRCELPVFDPNQFLDVVRGKSLAFVGDSVARNHMQSLICLLSRVVYPEDVSKSINDQNRRYEYRDHNFTISMFWSPYLVKVELTDPGNVTRPFKLYLDEFDEHWRSQVGQYDYVIISAGQWFMRPTYFYEKGKLVGCLYCPPSDNVTYLTSYFSYRRAFRTAFKAINSLDNFKGVTFLRTFAPSHFEGGAWDKGGKCARTRPFKRNETTLEDYAEKMYRIQLEELEIARREGRRKEGRRFRLFDATKSMLLRPDGHPSKYGHWPQQKVELPEDCVHWCLPGPIDTWNDFLLELLKREQENVQAIG